MDKYDFDKKLKKLAKILSELGDIHCEMDSLKSRLCGDIYNLEDMRSDLEAFSDEVKKEQENESNIRNIIKVLINAYRRGYCCAGGIETARDDRDDMYDCIKSSIRDLDLIQSVEEDTELSNVIWQLINEETAFVLDD